MARRLLAVPSAPTSPLLVIPRPAVAAAVDVAETVAVVVVDSVVVDSAVVVVAVTVGVVVASVVVAVAEIVVAVVVVTVAAVVALQGTEVALATSRGRRRGSIKDEIMMMMIPRGIMIMGGRMNRATWVGE